MAELVYGLCATMSTLCAVLLFRGYLASRTRLLLWSALCFVGLALNNSLLLVDVLVVPEVDLSVPRVATAVAGVSLLLFGLVWDSQ